MQDGCGMYGKLRKRSAYSWDLDVARHGGIGKILLYYKGFSSKCVGIGFTPNHIAPFPTHNLIRSKNTKTQTSNQYPEFQIKWLRRSHRL